MIDPTELRIGNWINTPRGPRRVSGVDDEHIYCYCEGAFRAVFFPKLQDDLSAITISDEWLHCLGFKRDGFRQWSYDISPFPNRIKWIYFSGDYIYLREGDGTEQSYNDDVVTLWNNDLRGIISVHQLQNLFHALSGKDLITPASSSSIGQRSGR